MRKSITVEPIADETVEKLLDYFAAANWIAQRIAVALILAGSNSDHPSRLSCEQCRILSAQILNAVATGKSIEHLLSPLSVLAKDSTILARSYFDSILNACYITLNQEYAHRAGLHRAYSEFRFQTRVRRVGNLTIKVRRSESIQRDHPIISVAIQEFDPKNTGKPKPMFNDDRFAKIEKIRLVCDRAAISLIGAEGLVYDIGSQFSHGEQSVIDQYLGSSEFGDEINDRCGQLAFISISSCMLSLQGLGNLLTPFDISADVGHLLNACDLYFKTACPEI